MKLKRKALFWCAAVAIAAAAIYSCTCGDLQWLVGKACATLNGDIYVNNNCVEIPLRGAKVTVTIDGTDYVTYTDSLGHYNFDDLPDVTGTYPIVITSDQAASKNGEVNIESNTIASYSATLVSNKRGRLSNMIRYDDGSTDIYNETQTSVCGIVLPMAMVVLPPDIPLPPGDSIDVISWQTDDFDFDDVEDSVYCRPDGTDFDKYEIIITVESKRISSGGFISYELDGTFRIGVKTESVPTSVIHNDEEVPFEDLVFEDGFVYFYTDVLGHTEFHFPVYRRVYKIERIPIVFNPSVIYGPTNRIVSEYECYEGADVDFQNSLFDAFVAAISDYRSKRKVKRVLDIPYYIPSGEVAVLEAYQELIWYEYTDCDHTTFSKEYGDIKYTIKDRQHTGGSN